MNTPLPERATARLAVALALGTIAWNVVEGGVSVAFGLSEESVALLGFGLDSWIEVASAGVVLWRLWGETGRGAGPSRERERSASRVISVLFMALALSAAGGAVFQLATASAPTSTLPGLIISSLSLSVMFALWRSKLRVARTLDSRTLEMDAACSRACIELSAVLLGGSLLVLLHPALWWADAAAALVIAALIGKEGLEGWRAANRPEFTGGCCSCGH